jgi:hypothetical protein
MPELEDYDVDEHGVITDPPKKERVPVSDAESWNLQISYKTRLGAMINIRATNADDLADGIKTIRDMTEDILDVEATLFGQTAQPAQQVPPALHAIGAQPLQQQPQAPSFVAQPQQQAQPMQQGNAPTCQHGLPAKYVQGGMSKTGRPYRAFWACPLDRDQQCRFRADA